ncbi:MAG TPA: hypothetical protein VGG89_09285 [Candidatus Baltobacteraceae bacterium]
MLSACSGGAMLPAQHPGSFAPSVGHDRAVAAKLEIRLRIPRRQRRARYISPSTKSLTIAEGETKLGTFNTTPNSKYCASGNGSTLCTFTVGTSPGFNRTIAIDTYDAAGGKGKLLSIGNVTKTIVTGRTNLISIVLGGVVASIVVAVERPNAAAGTPTSLGVAVTAKDAGGNVIIGPANYNVAIELTDSDTSKATTLSTTRITSPSTSVTLAYTGANLTTATIGATAAKLPSTSVTPADFRPTPAVVGSFELPRSLGADTGVALNAVAITRALDNKLWISVTDSALNSGLTYMTTTGAMTQIVPGTGVGTSLPNVPISGLAASTLGDKGVVYAADDYIGGINAAGAGGAQQLTTANFPAICSGASAKRVTTYGSGAATGGAWFTIACSSGSQLLNVAQSGATVSTLPSNFENPQQPLIGKDGKMYVAGEDANTSKAAIFQGTIVHGSIDPGPVLDVSSAGNQFVGLTQDPSGNLWATTGGCQYSYLVRVAIAATFGSSTATRVPTLAGCSSPAFLTALADGSLWVPESGQNEVTQVIPGANAAAPALYDLAVKTPPSVNGIFWDVAVGPDGYLYFTSNGYVDSTDSSNTIVKVAY